MSTAVVHPQAAQHFLVDSSSSSYDSPPSTSTSTTSLTPDPAKSVPATLHYNAALPTNAADDKWFININDNTDKNFTEHVVPTTIYDLNGQQHLTHIDVTGFQALTSPSTVPASLLLTASDDEIRSTYYPEVERLLLAQTGASRVVFFDHTVRKHLPGAPDTPQTRQPVQRVHVDQTPASAHVRVTRHVQPPRPYRRFQLINVWRPIENTVYDFPLAVCDFRTVDVVNDLRPTTLVYPPPTPNGETYSVSWSEQHRWWYWKEMTPSDVLLLKCYDSASRALTNVKESGADVQVEELKDVAGLTPHSAMLDVEGAKKGIHRQSIEVRALVFYD